jgi:chemotaxis signal transduction protein
MLAASRRLTVVSWAAGASAGEPRESAEIPYSTALQRLARIVIRGVSQPMPHITNTLAPERTPGATLPDSAQGGDERAASRRLKLQTVVFTRHGRLYAVPISRVLAVVLHNEATWLFPLPGQRELGIEPCCTLMRLVDLGRAPDAVAPRAPLHEQQILICHDDESVVGFLIDEIHGMRKLRWTEVRPLDGGRHRCSPAYAVGLTSLGCQPVTVISLGERAEESLTPMPGRPSLRHPDQDPGALRAGGDTHAAR